MVLAPISEGNRREDLMLLWPKSEAIGEPQVV